MSLLSSWTLLPWRCEWISCKTHPLNDSLAKSFVSFVSLTRLLVHLNGTLFYFSINQFPWSTLIISNTTTFLGFKGCWPFVHGFGLWRHLFLWHDIYLVISERVWNMDLKNVELCWKGLGSLLKSIQGLNQYANQLQRN